MRKRTRYIAVTALAVAAFVALLLGGIWLSASGDRVTKMNFDRIKKGMTRADVEAIFASPPHPADRPDRQRWFAEDGWTCAIIDFEKDLVSKAQWFDGPHIPITERFRRRMRWPW